jgi:hypothetical protein
MNLFGSRSIDPHLIEWTYIATIPTTPKEILTAFPGAIYVLAEDDRIFDCRKSLKEGRCKEISDFEVEEDHLQANDCKPFVELPMPPGVELDRYDYVDCFTGGRVQATFALLDDRSIWEWRYDSRSYSGLTTLICPMTTFIIALLLGIILGLRSLRSMEREQSLEETLSEG